MIIRPAKYQDKDEVLRLLQQRGVFNEQEIRVAMQVVGDSLAQTDKEEYLVFCACGENEGLLGYICFGPNTVTDNCYELYWLAVEERSSRMRIGGRLLSFMEEYVKEEGARRIYIDTSSTEAYKPARSFYEKHGYKLVCILEDFYRKGDHRMIYMKEMKKDVYPNIELTEVGQDSLRHR